MWTGLKESLFLVERLLYLLASMIAISIQLRTTERKDFVTSL